MIKLWYIKEELNIAFERGKLKWKKIKSAFEKIEVILREELGAEVKKDMMMIIVE